MIDKAVALGTLHNPCTNGDAKAGFHEPVSSFAFSQFYCLVLLCFALLCFALLCFALLCTQWLGFDTGGHDAAEVWVGESRAAAAKSMFAGTQAGQPASQPAVQMEEGSNMVRAGIAGIAGHGVRR
jgi:hypothetical protein